MNKDIPGEQSNGTEQKREMFQIVNRTGMSSDYINEIAPFWYQMGTQGLKAAILHLQKRPMKKYIECYPLELYENVVNEKNKGRIKELDGLVEVFNEKVKNETLTEEEFNEMWEKVKTLLHGNTE